MCRIPARMQAKVTSAGSTDLVVELDQWEGVLHEYSYYRLNMLYV